MVIMIIFFIFEILIFKKKKKKKKEYSKINKFSKKNLNIKDKNIF